MVQNGEGGGHYVINYIISNTRTSRKHPYISHTSVHLTYISTSQHKKPIHHGTNTCTSSNILTPMFKTSIHQNWKHPYTHKTYTRTFLKTRTFVNFAILRGFPESLPMSIQYSSLELNIKTIDSRISLQRHLFELVGLQKWYRWQFRRDPTERNMVPYNIALSKSSIYICIRAFKRRWLLPICR